MYFHYFIINTSWKRARPFIWTNLIIFTKGCFVTSLVEIGPVVLEIKILKFRQCIFTISLFRNYLPLEKGGALHLNKLESPSPKDALCQVWLKLVQWFWRRRFLNFINAFWLFCNYFPLEKGVALYFNKFENVKSLRQGRRFFNVVNVFS